MIRPDPEMRLAVYESARHERGWRELAARHPLASPYHSREWAQVLAATFGFRESSLVCLEGDAVAGLVPLWHVNARTLVNAPWRDRAPFLGRGIEHALEALRQSPEDVVLKGFDAPETPPEFSKEMYWITSVLDLTDGPQEVWKRINRTKGRNIRKAERCGVVVRRARDAENMADFYRLFQITRQRLGVPIYPRTLFAAMLRFLPETMLDVYVARLGDVPAAAAVCLTGPSGAIYAYGASNPTLQHVRPTDLVLWTAIRDSLDRGLSAFDFGADSPSQQPLLQYKHKWGCAQRVLPTLRKAKTRSDPERGDFSSDRFAWHRSILRRLPVAALTFLGAVLTRRDG